MSNLASLEYGKKMAKVTIADGYKPAPEFARIVTRLARVPKTLRMNRAPEVCKALDRRTGETLSGVLAGGAGSSSLTFPPGTLMSFTGIGISSSSSIKSRTRTLRMGED